MGSKASCFSVSLLLLLLLLLVFSTATYGDNDEQKPSRVKSIMLSLADTAFPYSEKAKLVVKKAHSYFFRPTPNLDFRGSGTKAETGDDERVIVASEMEKGGEEGRGGVGERVREAASKSLEKTKSTLEDSAKLAGNVLHEVTDKVKTSFGHHQHQGEL
ncbi:hypothetical protein QQ045_019393 [Rhodiola kirilowii]